MLTKNLVTFKKKNMGMGNYHKSYMQISAIILGLMVRSLDQRVHLRWYYQWKIYPQDI